MSRDWKDVLAADPDVGTAEYRAAYAEARRDHEIGKRVRELREAAGLSQTDLAGRVGTRQPNIARLEAGGRLPKIATLHRIAEALGMQLEVSFRPVAKRRRLGQAGADALAPRRAAPARRSAVAAAKAPAKAATAKAASKVPAKKAAPAKGAAKAPARTAAKAPAVSPTTGKKVPVKAGNARAPRPS
jgi:HTH-type transcriptional regulator/antitoxin HipB